MKTVLLLVGALLVGGCTTRNYATFVTKTSISVLDLDSTPAEASIAFSRTEGYKGPRFDDGTVYPVVGYLETSGAALNRSTVQVFAGGAAANIVVGRPGTVLPRNCSDQEQLPPMFLATGTSLGIRVGLEAGGVPSSFSFGYRRKEATLVPVSKECLPSVLATHDSDAKAEGATKASPGLGLSQYFATGSAADALAADKTIQAMFARKAQAAVSAVAAFDARNGAQSVQALRAINCAGHVKDTGFDKVVSNAGEMGLFTEAGIAADILRQASMAERRRRYAAELSLPLGDDAAKTRLLELHATRVCGMADAS